MKIGELTIKEIKQKLKDTEVGLDLIEKMTADSRQGVKKLAEKYRKKLERQHFLQKQWQQKNSIVEELQKQGFQLIAGLDEAGRGPLAGPVVAAAVILGDKPVLGLDDSKKLTASKREELTTLIEKKALAVGRGIVDNREIDHLNIQQATFLAMKRALHNLDLMPDYLLVDGNRRIPEINLPQKTVIEGDSRVNSIAAASIIAKVCRDGIIAGYDEDYPQYGFKRNKGYGTEEHIEALKKHGATPLHRFSYEIVQKYG